MITETWLPGDHFGECRCFRDGLRLGALAVSSFDAGFQNRSATDYIVLYMLMPRMDGYTALTRLNGK